MNHLSFFSGNYWPRLSSRCCLCVRGCYFAAKSGLWESYERAMAWPGTKGEGYEKAMYTILNSIKFISTLDSHSTLRIFQISVFGGWRRVLPITTQHWIGHIIHPSGIGNKILMEDTWKQTGSVTRDGSINYLFQFYINFVCFNVVHLYGIYLMASIVDIIINSRSLPGKHTPTHTHI